MHAGDGLNGQSVAGPDMHAVACAVPAEARDLVLPDRFEYADSFVVTLPPGTRSAAEDWARAMFMPPALPNKPWPVPGMPLWGWNRLSVAGQWARSAWCRFSANRRS
jgi:hypothetical protein